MTMRIAYLLDQPLNCSVYSTRPAISTSGNAPETSQTTPRTNSIHSGNAADQSQSLLLSRLPLEIRRDIYHSLIDRRYQPVLRSKTAHFIRHGDASLIRCVCHQRPCNSPGLCSQDDNRFCYSCSLAYGYRYGQPRERRKPPSRCDLLVVCRQIYYEAADLLTSNVMFNVIAQERDDLLILSDLKVTMPWAQYRAIRSLEFSYHIANERKEFDDFQSPLWFVRWAEFCNCLEQITGLRDLHMWINNEYSYNRRREMTPDQELQILEPLMKITGPYSFVVEVSWFAVSAAAKDLANAPFTLIRRPGFVCQCEIVRVRGYIPRLRDDRADERGLDMPGEYEGEDATTSNEKKKRGKIRLWRRLLCC